MPEFSDPLFFGFCALSAAAAGWWALRAYSRGAERPRPFRAVAGVALVAIAALGVYGFVGAPGQADQPHAERLRALQDKPFEEMTAEEVVALLEERARLNPDDPLPAFSMGEIFEQLGLYDRASVAFDRALRRASRGAADESRSQEERLTYLSAQGAALVRIARVETAKAGGAVPDSVAPMLQRAAMINPQDPEPWFMMAIGAGQSGRNEEAVGLWDEVISRIGPDHPMRPMADRMRARALAGETLRAPPPLPGPPGGQP